MRLICRGDEYIPQFTTVWEVEELASRADAWLPFCLVGSVQPIGEIHSETHEIRLYEGVVLRARQVVSLASPMKEF